MARTHQVMNFFSAVVEQLLNLWVEDAMLIRIGDGLYLTPESLNEARQRCPATMPGNDASIKSPNTAQPPWPNSATPGESPANSASCSANTPTPSASPPAIETSARPGTRQKPSFSLLGRIAYSGTTDSRVTLLFRRRDRSFNSL
jgi:hypothetical protein